MFAYIAFFPEGVETVFRKGRVEAGTWPADISDVQIQLEELKREAEGMLVALEGTETALVHG